MEKEDEKTTRELVFSYRAHMVSYVDLSFVKKKINRTKLDGCSKQVNNKFLSGSTQSPSHKPCAGGRWPCARSGHDERREVCARPPSCGTLVGRIPCFGSRAYPAIESRACSALYSSIS